MFISERRRRRARKEAMRRCALCICAMTAATTLGAVAGILIAPMSGKETRAFLKKGVEKTVETIEEAVSAKTKGK